MAVVLVDFVDEYADQGEHREHGHEGADAAEHTDGRRNKLAAA